MLESESESGVETAGQKRFFLVNGDGISYVEKVRNKYKNKRKLGEGDVFIQSHLQRLETSACRDYSL